MERIAAEGRARPPRSILTSFPSRRLLWPTVWAAVMVAGFGAIAVGLSMSSSYETRLHALAGEAAMLKADIDREQRFLAMLRDPATALVALSGLEPAPSARARIVWNENAGGFLVADGLPPTPAGKVYQLWASVGKNPPVPAGVFNVDAKGAGSLRVPPLTGVGKVDVFAVTLEPAGGLPAPSGRMYLAGKS
jgi:anti-sigma-K factor RskA